MNDSKEQIIKDFKSSPNSIGISVHRLLDYIDKENGFVVKTIDGTIYYCLSDVCKNGLRYYKFKDVFIIMDNSYFHYYPEIKINKNNISYIAQHVEY